MAEQRTKQQNRALHLYFKMLADDLNDAGYDVMTTLRHDIAVPWNDALIKELMWKGLMVAMTEKESTADLDTKQVSEVYDVLNKHLGERFGIHTPFPQEDR